MVLSIAIALAAAGAIAVGSRVGSAAWADMGGTGLRPPSISPGSRRNGGCYLPASVKRRFI